MKKYIWILLILSYLFVCVMMPCSLHVKEDSCAVGTTEICYVIRNRSILPYRGVSDAILEKQVENGWVEIEEPHFREDIGMTIGLLDAEYGQRILREPLEAGSYRLTVWCNYSLLGRIEKSEAFDIE